METTRINWTLAISSLFRLDILFAVDTCCRYLRKLWAKPGAHGLLAKRFFFENYKNYHYRVSWTISSQSFIYLWY